MLKESAASLIGLVEELPDRAEEVFWALIG
jgi:hypothetical protein